MNSYYRHVNRHGTWTIRPSNEFWIIAWNDEDLGSYRNMIGALEDLVGGYCFLPSSGVDPADCNLPDDIGDWEIVRGRHR